MGKLMRSAVSVRPSICFHSTFWTNWPATLIFCTCMTHESWPWLTEDWKSRITSLFCCTDACTGLSRCIHKGSVRGHFESCFYFHWSVWTSPLISFIYMKMNRKPKHIMLKAYDYSVMFYFSSDVFDFTSVIIRDLSIAVNWNLALRGCY